MSSHVKIRHVESPFIYNKINYFLIYYYKLPTFYFFIYFIKYADNTRIKKSFVKMI